MSVTFRIERGVRVRVGDATYTITSILPDLETVMAKATDGGHLVRLPVRDLRHPDAPDKRTETVIDLAGVNDAAWTEAERRMGLIEPLLQGRRTRAAVEAQALEAGVHWTTLYGWIRAYETTGRMSALLPTVRPGGRGQSRLPEEVEAVVQEVVQEQYLDAQRRNASQVIREIQLRLRRAGLRVAGRNTIGRRISAISIEERTKRRQGRRKAEEQFGPKAGHYEEAIGPLVVVQIDHTQMDIVVVDDVDRLPIGRPWLTLAIDVFSRMVVGFYISLDPPGAASVGFCLAHAILPKETWLAAREIEGAKWPVWGFMAKIHADNAREFRGEMLRRACKEYRMDLQWRPVKKPRYGAHIERLMGTVATEIHALPGTTFSNPDERGDYDSEGKAVFTLRELEAWFARWVSKEYHVRPHRGLGNATPLDRWEAGILGTQGFTATGLQARDMDEDRVRLDLMPYVERTVQDTGVSIDVIEYYDSVLRRYADAREPGRAGQKRKFRFRRDPRDISTVYFYASDTKQYYPIPYRNASRPPMSLWQLRAATRRAKEQVSKVDEQAIFDAHEERHRELQKVVERTRTARKPKSVKARREVQRDAENRRAEKPLRPQEHPAPEAAPAVTAAAEGARVRRVLPFDDIDENL